MEPFQYFTHFFRVKVFLVYFPIRIRIPFCSISKIGKSCLKMLYYSQAIKVLLCPQFLFIWNLIFLYRVCSYKKKKRVHINLFRDFSLSIKNFINTLSFLNVHATLLWSLWKTTLHGHFKNLERYCTCFFLKLFFFFFFVMNQALFGDFSCQYTKHFEVFFCPYNDVFEKFSLFSF